MCLLISLLQIAFLMLELLQQLHQLVHLARMAGRHRYVLTVISHDDVTMSCLVGRGGGSQAAQITISIKHSHFSPFLLLVPFTWHLSSDICL